MPIARRFHELGFRILATAGTAKYLRARGIPAERVLKVYEGRPNGIDLILSGEVHLLVNTPLGKLTQQDDYSMRRAALQHGVPYTTTMSAACRRGRRDHRHEEPTAGGALAAGMAPTRPRGDDIVTSARDPGIRLGAPRPGRRGGARGRTAGALVDLPNRRTGHGA